ncbi:MAG: transcription termination factor Rho [Lachnospiraceae bacterium]|nr:transcription termination factor Rho [Lachnospiraceae bacterium]
MDYQSMLITELKAIAKERGIKGVSGAKKAELTKILEDYDKKNAPKKEVKAEPKKIVKKTVVKEEAKKVVKPEAKNVKAEPAKSEAVKPEATKDKREFQAKKTFDKEGVRREANVKFQPSKQRDERVKKDAKPHDAAEENRQRKEEQLKALDSGETAYGILEIMPEGFGFIRSENYLPGENDVYVSPSTIRYLNLRTGDMLKGNKKIKSPTEKYQALLRVTSVNGFNPEDARRRIRFEDLTPIFPDERIKLENEYCNKLPMRIVDLLSPVGKGQRGMIVSPPKAGKTTLLKQIAKSVSTKYPDMVLIVLLIDERPEEVTDFKESIDNEDVDVIYSTFDELPEHHKRVSEMVLERAKRLVEHGKDVMILLDSITRLARAYNLTVTPSGRTLSGGLDPAALHMPKKFFGAARNMRNGGSLTILATALVDTGSRMDDVVFEEFKGTGNMELVLDRALSEKRIFPAIDINKSGTRRDDLLLTDVEQRIATALHREMTKGKAETTVEEILKVFQRTKNNQQFIDVVTQLLKL